MQDLKLFNNELSMTLKEITDLLEVRHNDAMKTVERMSKSQEFGLLRDYRIKQKTGFGEKDLDTYLLDKRQTLAVASKLNTNLLFKVIDRLEQLEQEKSYNTFKLPTTYEEALEDLLVKVKENKRLEQQVEYLEPFKEKVDNAKAIFSKKEKVYDKEVGYKKDIKSQYPFITNDKLSMILEYYTKSKFKDTNNYIKDELSCIELFFSECDMEVKPDGKSVAVSHECLLGRNMFVRKEPAIKYLGYCEEDFE
jgi:hypothetical protein